MRDFHALNTKQKENKSQHHKPQLVVVQQCTGRSCMHATLFAAEPAVGL